MPTFVTTREAKEFVVAAIVSQAEWENVPLSELERKMLYFSETAWILPDIYEVNEAFEQVHDSPTYEAKIASLIRNLRERLRKELPEELASWKSAVRLLKTEDHYLLVLIGIADGRFSADSLADTSFSFAKLLGLSILGFLLFAIAFFVYSHFFL